MEDERLRLAEGVDRGVQEAREEGGVELHRAGRVEQQHEAQRTKLAPPPDEIDRRPAMGDAMMDRAPEVEPRACRAAPASAARAARACAGRAARRAHELSPSPAGRRCGGCRGSRAPRPTRPRRAGLRSSMRRRASSSAGAAFLGAMAARSGAKPEGRGLRCAAGAAAAAAQRLDPAHALPAPERVEQLVEPPPVLARRRRKARAKAGFQQGRAAGRPARRERRARRGSRRVRSRSRSRAGRWRKRRCARAGSRSRGRRVMKGLAGSAMTRLTRPCRSDAAVVSRVSRARSSCVFSRQIRVSCTISGDWRRSSSASPARVAAQSSVSATPGALRRSSCGSPRRAGDLRGERGGDAWRSREDDRRFALDVGKIDIVIEAAPPQRVGELARVVRGQYDARDRHRRDRAEFGDRDLIVGEELEQERLEFLVGAVDLVDQQHRRLGAPDRRQKRAFEQVLFGKDLLLDALGRFRRRPRAP